MDYRREGADCWTKAQGEEVMVGSLRGEGVAVRR